MFFQMSTTMSHKAMGAAQAPADVCRQECLALQWGQQACSSAEEVASLLLSNGKIIKANRLHVLSNLSTLHLTIFKYITSTAHGGK